MNERHSIYLNKEAGNPWPWTNDSILQKYKFTNPFRQNDAVTKVLTTEITTPHYNAEPDLLFANIATFRMFNWPATYRNLGGWRTTWSEVRAKKILNKQKAQGRKIFTGAYIITNAGSKSSKVDYICESITPLWKNRKTITKKIMSGNSLQVASAYLQSYPAIGRFIAYELVTDLRHTPILNTAEDIGSWANPGPGAKRGLNRIHGRHLKFTQPDDKFIEEMRTLLSLANVEITDELSTGSPGQLSCITHNYTHAIEMRDIEHSLCEFDKYLRVKNGEGRPRSLYKNIING